LILDWEARKILEGNRQINVDLNRSKIHSLITACVLEFLRVARNEKYKQTELVKKYLVNLKEVFNNLYTRNDALEMIVTGIKTVQSIEKRESGNAILTLSLLKSLSPEIVSRLNSLLERKD